MKFHFLLLCFLLFGGISEGYCASGDNDSGTINDVRVLIDVSGSMKRNDSDNLRIPALKLLVDLLPSDARAGVWLFAADPITLVPFGDVDEEWKGRALKAASGIHSRGLFTNIENALKKATEGWQGSDEKANRSIILLTDGVVDVSKNPEASRASRTAILDHLIPELQSLSARIYSIALSENADQELLKKLSFDTGGWNRSVQSAEQLERAFLTMFKKAVPRDSVPLTSNKFTIDSSIEEFSVLVFREPGAEPTRLIDPEDSQFGQADHRDKVRWHHEDSYDLITIEQPESGEWQLVADVDPDNQVMVVTDLKLELNDLPNYVSAGEGVEFMARITEKGEALTNPDFLRLIKIRLEQSDDLGRKRDWMFNADPSEIGSFKQEVAQTLVAGKHTFTVLANARTFQREVEHRIEVVESTIDVEISPTRGPEASSVRIQLVPDADIIDMLSLKVEADVTHASGEKEKIDLSQSNGVRELVIDIPPPGQRAIVNFSVSAKTLRGNTINPAVKPLVIDRDLLDSLNKKKEKPAPEQWLEESKSDEERTPATTEPDWITTGIIAGVVNLIFLTGGFFVYRHFQKRSAKQQTQLIDRLAT